MISENRTVWIQILSDALLTMILVIADDINRRQSMLLYLIALLILVSILLFLFLVT